MDSIKVSKYPFPIHFQKMLMIEVAIATHHSKEVTKCVISSIEKAGQLLVKEA